ncbi:MAG: tyrosine-protein phosphatase [Panacagrimonas sp.]
MTTLTTPDFKPILFDGLHNFRDFGGCLAADGRHVRSDRLFRSDMLSDLSGSDIETLDALGLGLVCDLRSRGERDRYPDRWPGDKPVLTLSLDDAESLDAVRPERWQRRLEDPDFDATQAHQSLLDNYRRMPRAYANDIRELLRFLATQPDQGVLVHCAVGKDRTGFVSAMLLWSLGVPLAGILRDYLSTNTQFPPDELLRLRGNVLPHPGNDTRVRDALRVLASVNEDFLMAAIGQAERDHGTVEQYLERACELTPGRREALVSNLLERTG